jgi:hypothetical protein
MEVENARFLVMDGKLLRIRANGCLARPMEPVLSTDCTTMRRFAAIAIDLTWLQLDPAGWRTRRNRRNDTVATFKVLLSASRTAGSAFHR